MVSARPLRVLIVHTAYWNAVTALIDSSGAKQRSQSHGQNLVTSLALSANYSPRLIGAGIDASDYVFNWPAEVRPGKTSSTSRLESVQYQSWQLFSSVPGVRNIFTNFGRPYVNLRTSIEDQNPDVVLFLNINLVTPETAAWIKSRGIELWGQHASALPCRSILKNFDFLFSALPWQVDFFRRLGLTSEFLPLGIPLSQIVKEPEPLVNRAIDLAFVGSVGWTHKASIGLLRELAEAIPSFQIFTSASRRQLLKTGLLANHAGEAHGNRGLDVYRQSKIVLNRHIKVAKGYSANFRMYEATGSGALLLTEESENLHHIFSSNEVLSYSTSGEAIAKVKQVLSSLSSYQKVATAGHQRTLNEHTIELRGDRLAEWLMLKARSRNLG